MFDEICNLIDDDKKFVLIYYYKSKNLSTICVEYTKDYTFKFYFYLVTSKINGITYESYQPITATYDKATRVINLSIKYQLSIVQAGDVDKIVGKNNTTVWTPTYDYGVVHKKYVDDLFASSSGGGTTDYNELSNKPTINDVTLEGNTTLEELGVQPAGNYALKSDVNELRNADIKEFKAATPFSDGLTVINAVTNNNTNIVALDVYNGLDAKYPNAAFGTKSAKELADRLTSVETNIPKNLSSLNNDLFIQASSEEEALSLSKSNPDKFYYWTE